MGKGTDLAHQIVDMVREYNRVIKSLNTEIDDLNYSNRAVCQKLDNTMESVKTLENTLTTVTDIICRHIKHSQDNIYIDSLWDWENDYHTLINTLDITIGVSEVTESEEKENED